MKTTNKKQVSKIHIGKSFWGLISLLAILFCTRLLFDSGFFLNLIYLIGIFLLISFLYTYFVLDGISIERQSRYDHRNVGDIFDENILIKNRFILPVFWLELSDLSGIGFSRTNRVVGMIQSRKTRMLRLVSILGVRGKYALSPMEIQTSDPLGCFRSTRRINTNGSLVITPYRVKLSPTIRKFEISEYGTSGDKATKNASVISTSVREYTSGDPINRIHWPTTARTGKLHTKLTDTSIMRDVWIFLDCNKHAHFSDLNQEKGFFFDITKIDQKFTLPADTFETAVSLCASLAYSFLSVGLSVGLALNHLPKIVFRPETGLRQQRKILNALTHIRPGESIPINSMIRGITGREKPGCVNFIISPDAALLADNTGESLRRNWDIRLIQIDRNTYGAPEAIGDFPKNTYLGKNLQFCFGDNPAKLQEFL